MIEKIQNKLPDDNLQNLDKEIHIYYASQELEIDEIDSLEKILSGEEIERAERFYFERDKKYYIVSRGILRVILSKYLKIDCNDIHFNYNEFGKPEIKNTLNNKHLEFNLSHSNGKVIYALVAGRKIGVDIERVRPIDRKNEIVNSFFSEKEKNEFNSLSEELKKMAFWNCWTRKEAYIKAHGRGLNLPLHQFSVSLLDEKIELDHVIDGYNAGENWTINDVKLDEEFISAVAYSGDLLPIVCRKLL